MMPVKRYIIPTIKKKGRIIPQRNPIINRGMFGVIQRRKKLPTVSNTMGKEMKIKILVLGKVVLDNPFNKG